MLWEGLGEVESCCRGASCSTMPPYSTSSLPQQHESPPLWGGLVLWEGTRPSTYFTRRPSSHTTENRPSVPRLCESQQGRGTDGTFLLARVSCGSITDRYPLRQGEESPRLAGADTCPCDSQRQIGGEVSGACYDPPQNRGPHGILGRCCDPRSWTGGYQDHRLSAIVPVSVLIPYNHIAS